MRLNVRVLNITWTEKYEAKVRYLGENLTELCNGPVLGAGSFSCSSRVTEHTHRTRVK